MGEVKRYAYHAGKMIECEQVPAGIKCFVACNAYDALRVENAELVAALEAQSTFWDARLAELGCLSSEACEVKALVDAAIAKHRGDK